MGKEKYGDSLKILEQLEKTLSILENDSALKAIKEFNNLIKQEQENKN